MRLSQHHIHFLFTKVDCLGLGVSKEINILQAIENGKKLHVQVEVLVYWKVVKHGIVSLWRPYLMCDHSFAISSIPHADSTIIVA